MQAVCNKTLQNVQSATYWKTLLPGRFVCTLEVSKIEQEDHGSPSAIKRVSTGHLLGQWRGVAEVRLAICLRQQTASPGT